DLGAGARRRGAPPDLGARGARRRPPAPRAGPGGPARLARAAPRLALRPPGGRHRAALHRAVAGAVHPHAAGPRDHDPRPAQRRGGDDDLHGGAAHPHGRRRTRRRPRPRDRGGDGDGGRAAATTRHRRAAPRRTGDLCRAPRRRGEQRQHRQRGCGHRRQPARVAVHRRLPAQLRRPDRHRAGGMRPAGARPRRADPGCHPARDPVAAGGPL
ncbi:MAG: ABC transporter, permease protein (cluster 13, osmolytes), partial [uncultured Nocardioidaceae bacterium]